MKVLVAFLGRHQRKDDVSFDCTCDILPPLLVVVDVPLLGDRLDRVCRRRAAHRFRHPVHRLVREGERTTWWWWGRHNGGGGRQVMVGA